VLLQFAVDTKRIVVVQMRFQKGNWEGGSKSAQTTADGWSMSIYFNFDEFPVDVSIKRL